MKQLIPGILLGALAACGTTPTEEVAERSPPPPSGLHGALATTAGAAQAGMMVTATSAANVRTTVFTNADGAFAFEGLADGAYEVSAHYPGYKPATATIELKDGKAEGVAMSLEPGDWNHDMPTSSFWELLPAGDMRQEFILNCGTCHGIGADRILKDGAVRTEAQWAEAIAAMRAMDVYEVIPPDFDDAAYATWLAENLAADKLAAVKAPAPMDPAVAANITITEWTTPHAETELPHDLVMGPKGRVWVTGFWTGEMWALDPATGTFETFDVNPDADPKIPAQTRALEFDKNGILWAINGGTKSVVSLDPATKEVKVFPVDMYAHDIVLDSKGDVWFNDYFAKKERIGHLKVADGTVETFDLPGLDTPPEVGIPLPYGLMVDADDRLYSTQLAGNTLATFDIKTQEAKLYPMPDANVGPRRTAMHPDGSLWIPEYNTGRVTRFDPKTEAFDAIELGVGPAGPYDADINQKTGEVWVSGSLDTSLFRVDPTTKAVTRIQLPTLPTLIRHMAVDENTGDVWVAYSSLPTAKSMVARISMN